jgi:hypothetical protein
MGMNYSGGDPMYGLGVNAVRITLRAVTYRGSVYLNLYNCRFIRTSSLPPSLSDTTSAPSARSSQGAGVDPGPVSATHRIS